MAFSRRPHLSTLRLLHYLNDTSLSVKGRVVVWEVIAAEVLKNIVVPELAEFIKKKFTETGEWPTKEELDALVDKRAEDIKRVGLDFLNRPPQN